jgi:UDP:flavonoid glycosyltransferase YjiC (YdhE family)
VPLVAAGATEDKPEIANRIAWSGVGLNLNTQTPAPERIRAAVGDIVRDPRYRRRARAIAAEIARYDAPSTAVRLLEELAATRRPIPAVAHAGQGARQGAARA